jgi:galactokinase
MPHDPLPPVELSTQLARAADAFRAAFGRDATVAAAAPGRVNLIGEHTDYNGGFVLPLAIDRNTVALAAPRPGKLARLASTAFPGDIVELPVDIDGQTIHHAPITLPDPSHWSRYLRGVLAFSYTPGGFDLLIDSAVPAGGGLSSSASIELATATVLESLFKVQLPGVNKALLCQMAEHRYGGAPCGIMDQFISAMGQEGRALLIDCRSLETKQAPLDDPGVAVLVVNSNVKHALSDGGYAARRAACERAAAKLGVETLRDADEATLAAAGLDAVTLKRARHAVRENLRPVACVAALERRDYAEVGRLMAASHASLRDDYEVSVPELDTLVELAVVQEGVIGSRMTGGGFGGCTVTLVKADRADAAGRAIAAGYRAATGGKREASWFVTRAAGGARAVELPVR